MQTCLPATKSTKIHWNIIYKIWLFVLILVLKLLEILFNVIYLVAYNEFSLGKQKKRSLWQVKWWRGSKESRKKKDSVSSLPVKIFSDGLDSPELAKLLAYCLKSILKIFTFHEKSKESKTNVTESLDFMPAKFRNLEKKSRKKMKRLIS